MTLDEREPDTNRNIGDTDGSDSPRGGREAPHGRPPRGRALRALQFLLAGLAGATIALLVNESAEVLKATSAKRDLGEKLRDELLSQVDAMLTTRMGPGAREGDTLAMCPYPLSPTPVWASAIAAGAIAQFPTEVGSFLALAYDRIDAYRGSLAATPCLPVYPRSADDGELEYAVAEEIWEPVFAQHQALMGAAIASSVWALAALHEHLSVEVQDAVFGPPKDYLAIGAGPVVTLPFALDVMPNAQMEGFFPADGHNLRGFTIVTKEGLAAVVGPWPVPCHQWDRCTVPGETGFFAPAVYVCGGSCL